MKRKSGEAELIKDDRVVENGDGSVLPYPLKTRRFLVCNIFFHVGNLGGR